ncbi:MAG: flagellar biosynthesis protein FlhA [Candidatus Cloacimonadota bacterium]|nr:MAG: flagellar biosynthesis protein FlhA [Candidatus Cloacimonadota bacterium]
MSQQEKSIQNISPSLRFLGGIYSKIKANANMVFAIIVVGIVSMMIVPLPPFVLDILMSVNIAIGFILLLTAIYIEDALEFSVFPSLLLITTLFRLGLNISSTRLILLDAAHFDGEVIKAFGEVVVGGNYVVGIIIFVILVIVQFMVITKGAERITEVKARFTLDALPGKQMSIDSDLNAGLIDETGAKARRETIQKEIEFYGAMDGASKFVKGDSIAGIIITVINIIGGILIGFFSGEFDGIAEIAEVYTSLTVGDGLVSIVPSLLIATATGIVATKSTSKDKLGTEVLNQFTNSPKALSITSGVFLVFALVPGLPKLPFIIMSVMIGTVAYILEQDIDWEAETAGEDPPSGDGSPTPEGGGDSKEGGEEAESSGPEDVSTLLEMDTLELEIGYGLIPMVDPNQGGDLLNRVKLIRRQIALELGLVVPAIRIRDNMQLSPNVYSIKLRGIEIGSSEIYHDRFLAMDPGMVVERINDGIPTTEPAFNLPALWIEENQRDDAELNGYTVVDAPSVIATHLTELIKRHADEILGRQDVKELIDKLKEKYEAVVTSCVPDSDNARLGVIQKVLKNLLREQVSIRNLPTILETISDFSDMAKDIAALTEYVRQGLARQITNEYVQDGMLKVFTIDPVIEQKFADSVVQSSSIHQALSPQEATALFDNLNKIVEDLLIQGISPVLICSPVIRTSFKMLVERVSPQLVVISYNEVMMDIQIDNVAVLDANLAEGQNIES